MHFLQSTHLLLRGDFNGAFQHFPHFLVHECDKLRHYCFCIFGLVYKSSRNQFTHQNPRRFVNNIAMRRGSGKRIVYLHCPHIGYCFSFLECSLKLSTQPPHKRFQPQKLYVFLRKNSEDSRTFLSQNGPQVKSLCM